MPYCNVVLGLRHLVGCHMTSSSSVKGLYKTTELSRKTCLWGTRPGRNCLKGEGDVCGSQSMPPPLGLSALCFRSEQRSTRLWKWGPQVPGGVGLSWHPPPTEIPRYVAHISVSRRFCKVMSALSLSLWMSCVNAFHQRSKRSSRSPREKWRCTDQQQFLLPWEGVGFSVQFLISKG